MSFFGPFHRLWLNERHRRAGAEAQVVQLRHLLAVSEAGRKATVVHFDLAVKQRDRARDIAGAVADEQVFLPTDADYDDWLRSLSAPDDGGSGAWLYGEGPA